MILFIYYSRYMDRSETLRALAALAQETRLDVFRLLAGSGLKGMCAGEIARALNARQNTTSTNLAILSRAGLITSVREGRSVRFFADADGMRGLLAYLLEDCCGGAPGTCASFLKKVTRLAPARPNTAITITGTS